MLKKALIFIAFIFLLTKPLLGLYYLNINIKNCENLLVEYNGEIPKNLSNGPFNITVNQVCLYFKNGGETCYNISLSDLMTFIPGEGIKMNDYVVISANELPTSLVVKDYNGSVICSAEVSSCVNCETINNESISNNVTAEANIKYHDISGIVLISIVIISIIILIIWKFMK